MRASGFRPLEDANSSLHTMIAAAPSVKGEDVAAVTVPDSENTGLNPDIASNDVSERMHPSELTVPVSELISISS